ncbi:MAG: DMT family transporter [Caldithrix sp.]|nr:MAG: DMT family transporter [Caldithrix sp.]
MNKINRKHTFFIIAASTLYGLITVGGQFFANSGFSLYEISGLIFFLAISLAPLLVFKKEYRIPREQITFFIIFGFIGAGLQIGQFAGIILGVPVAVVALLLYSQPIWTSVFSRFFLNEAITTRKLLALLLALTGIIVLVNPFGIQNKFSTAGLGAALGAGVFFSLWVIWGRKSALKNQHFLTTTFGFSFFTSLWLLLLYPLATLLWEEPKFARFDPGIYLEFWWAVAGFTIFAGLMPNFLAFAGMRKVDASTTGVLLLFEPISAAILAFIFFNQPLTSNIWLGGGFLLLANYVLLRTGSS